MLVCSIVGARPNYMKVAPIMEALKKLEIPQLLVHTGQHYDSNLSQVFFEELGIPAPDIFLGIGSDTQTRQTARVMIDLEEVFAEKKPSLILAVGDVNSTLAAALTGSKMGLPVAHIEAGLRSFDRTMPEETNRIVTDHLSDLLFTTEESGNRNLVQEGIKAEKIYFVGNCMIDTLMKYLDISLRQEPWKKVGLEPGYYGLLTLHRPSNVDDPDVMASLVQIANESAQRLPFLFPVHPRTRARMFERGLKVDPGIILCEPLPYLSFLGLMSKARVVLTDSGGIQEETTALHVPCLTLRKNTERPVTITNGTNKLVGVDPQTVLSHLDHTLAEKSEFNRLPPLWDGKAAHRIAEIINEAFFENSR